MTAQHFSGANNPKRSKMLRSNGVVVDLENIQFVSPLSGVLKAMRDRIWELEAEVQRYRAEDHKGSISRAAAEVSDRMADRGAADARAGEEERRMSLRPAKRRDGPAGADDDDDEEDGSDP